MGTGSKAIAVLFCWTLIWGSFELYHKMRLEEFMSAPALGFGLLSVGCMVLNILIAKAAIDS
jgi:TRAP-type C4-dicarboxylate transport system permease small subunit